MRLAPFGGENWGAAQVGVSVTVPLAVLLAAGRADLVAYAVFGALASVYGKDSSRGARIVRQAGVGCALIVSVGLGVAVGDPRAQGAAPLVALGLVSLLGFLITRGTGWLPVPSLFLVFSTGTVAAQGQSVERLPLALGVAALSVTFSIAVGQVVAGLQREDRLDALLRTEGRSPFGGVGDGAMVALHALVPTGAALLALGLGWGHSFWAAVAATVPLVGATGSARGVRTVQRAVGTVVGVLFAALVLALEPSTWAVVLIVASCQVVTELFVRRNYAIAVMAMTPMALLLSDLGAVHDAGQLAMDRLLCTLLGLAVSIVCVLVATATRRS